MDQLADDYSDQPAFFVEWGTGYYPGSRLDMLEESGGGQYVPEMMIDSSRKWQTGVDYNGAKALVDEAMARPAKGIITGDVTITGRVATLTVSVTNNSGITLNTANKAAVHGIVYEEYRQQKTNRIGRNAAKVAISNLPNGSTQEFTITLDLNSVVNLQSITFLAVVDYKTSTKANGLYDQIQAAQLGKVFTVSPALQEFDFAWDDEVPTGTVNITGSEDQTWTATTDKDWLILNQTSGDINSSMTFTFDTEKLVNGNQQAVITFKDGANLFEKRVTVKVKYEVFVPPAFNVFPLTLTRTIKETDNPVQPSGVRVTGDTGQTYTAVANNDFMSITSASGNVPNTFLVNFDKSKLVAGINEGSITVKDGAGYHEIVIPVKITYVKEGGEEPVLENIYFPLICVK